MTLINRETDYAIRILRALADEDIRNVNNICSEQDITSHFAYKIIKKLEKAGLVSIERGKQGGVRKAVSFEDVSLYDLMNALGNIHYVNDCFKTGHNCEYSQNNRCRTHEALASLQQKIDEELKKVRLYDLCN